MNRIVYLLEKQVYSIFTHNPYWAPIGIFESEGLAKSFIPKDTEDLYVVSKWELNQLQDVR